MRQLLGGNISRCGWWTDGLQGVCGKHVSEFGRPDSLQGLYTELHDGSVPERQLHGQCDWRVHNVWGWFLPRCGSQQHGMQDLHEQLRDWNIHDWQLHDACHADVLGMRSQHVSRCVWCSNSLQELYTQLRNFTISERYMLDDGNRSVHAV